MTSEEEKDKVFSLDQVLCTNVSFLLTMSALLTLTLWSLIMFLLNFLGNSSYARK